ncbi:MAG: branched-chain amino acid ABC transporter permease [Deltaproteobacteria bacterium]|nr:branched-chain amino acid ABC transporter permease [Deltaproteobacteria bacterium]
MEEIETEWSRPLPGWPLNALRMVAPVVMGYIPVGFAYGVLARQSGISEFNTLIMSVLVFAGSAQLIAVSLIGAGAGPLAIIATTFVVNLRHTLMSAAMSPALRHWPKRILAVFAFELTDETFALHSARATRERLDRGTTLMVNAIAQSAWVTGTALGILTGNMVGDVRPLGLDFALAAMFIFLLLDQIRSRAHLVSAAAGGTGALALSLFGFGQASVIMATILGASIGYGVEQWTSRRSS